MPWNVNRNNVIAFCMHTYICICLQLKWRKKEMHRNDFWRFFIRVLNAYSLRQPTNIDRCIMHTHWFTNAYRIHTHSRIVWPPDYDSNSKTKFLILTGSTMMKKATTMSIKDCLILYTLRLLNEMKEICFAGSTISCECYSIERESVSIWFPVVRVHVASCSIRIQTHRVMNDEQYFRHVIETYQIKECYSFRS